ncbi:hypothetical protein ACLOJK_000081 [Asimina triloba]
MVIYLHDMQPALIYSAAMAGGHLLLRVAAGITGRCVVHDRIVMMDSPKYEVGMGADAVRVNALLAVDSRHCCLHHRRSEAWIFGATTGSVCVCRFALLSAGSEGDDDNDEVAVIARMTWMLSMMMGDGGDGLSMSLSSFWSGPIR